MRRVIPLKAASRDRIVLKLRGQIVDDRVNEAVLIGRDAVELDRATGDHQHFPTGDGRIRAAALGLAFQLTERALQLRSGRIVGFAVLLQGRQQRW
jgi:hypothetical protein